MPDDHHEAIPDPSPNAGEPGLAAAAHEIRASLLSVKVALETVLEGGLSVDRERLLERSLAEVRELATSVEDLLGWTVGDRPLRRAPTELVGLVSDVVARVIAADGADRVVVRAPEPIRADVDEARLRIALANLLRNALAYGAPESPVEVAVQGAAGGVEISVWNRGGVGSASGSIFAPGVRRDPEGRNPSGHGLGLFIARRVVEAHGGTLRLESGELETRFVIQLDRAAS